MPLQVEILKEDPYVIQVHNFIGDGLIRKIKNAVVDNLERSSVKFIFPYQLCNILS